MKRLIKWAAIFMLFLAGVAILAVVLLNVIPGSPLTVAFDVQPETILIPTDGASIAHGRYLAESVLVCVVCHGEDLAGKEMIDDPFRYIHTPNLTTGAGGVGQTYSDADWVRAIRHGVDPEGHGLIFMPTDHYFHLSDADLGAVIAYMKSLAPVDNTAPGLALNPVVTALLNSGQSGEVVRARVIDHDAKRPSPPADYGAYLVKIGGCDFCHGLDLTGGQGPEPGAPPAPNITASGPWGQRTFAEFAHTLRTGIMPGGQPINPAFMPWVGYGRMTDEDLMAIWSYLQSLN